MPGSFRCAVSLVALVACAPPEPKVGKARLAEADGVVARPTGPTVEILPGSVPAALPGGTVGVAPDRDVRWREVNATMKDIERSGGTGLLLVAHKREVRALAPREPRPSNAIQLDARSDGKACVSLPGDPEANCVARSDGKHIDRAFVRELVRTVAKNTGLAHVHVIIDPELSFGDAVRAIDGARTCCTGRTMTVSYE